MASAQPGFSAADTALKPIEDNGGYARLAQSEIITNYLGSTSTVLSFSCAHIQAKSNLVHQHEVKTKVGPDNRNLTLFMYGDTVM